MIRARSRHLKCTARDKAPAISIKIVVGDWLKSQNLTKNGLKFYFLTCFLSQIWLQCRRFCFCRVLLPWHMGNWFKSTERVFSHQPLFWIALHSWKFSVSFCLKRFHNISLSHFKYCRS